MPIRDLVEPAEQGLGEFDTEFEFDTDSVNAFKLTFKDTSDIYFSFISKHLRDY